MPLVELTSAMSALSGVAKALQVIRQLSHDTKINEAVIDLQTVILDLQTKLFEVQAKHEELAKVKGEIEQKLMEQEDWNTAKQDYEPRNLRDGIIVYTKKGLQNLSSPFDWFCPRCFGKRQLSIFSKYDVDHRDYKCVSCGYQILPTSQN
jgi:hypothetical protein